MTHYAWPWWRVCFVPSAISSRTMVFATSIAFCSRTLQPAVMPSTKRGPDGHPLKLRDSNNSQELVRRSGCNHCISCCGLLQATSSRRAILTGCYEWWPAAHESPTSYFRMRAKQLRFYQLREATRPDTWRSPDCGGCSQLRARRGLPHLTLQVPNVFTNLAPEDLSIQHLTALLVPLAPQQQQQQQRRRQKQRQQQEPLARGHRLQSKGFIPPLPQPPQQWMQPELATPPASADGAAAESVHLSSADTTGYPSATPPVAPVACSSSGVPGAMVAAAAAATACAQPGCGQGDLALSDPPLLAPRQSGSQPAPCSWGQPPQPPHLAERQWVLPGPGLRLRAGSSGAVLQRCRSMQVLCAGPGGSNWPAA